MAYPTDPIYKLVNSSITGELSCILTKTSFGAKAIPIEPKNKDYQDYLLWVSEGGVAEAAD